MNNPDVSAQEIEEATELLASAAAGKPGQEETGEALTRLGKRLLELESALRPFAERGATIVRKRGPAIEYSLRSSEPVPVGALVTAAKAMGLVE